MDNTPSKTSRNPGTRSAPSEEVEESAASLLELCLNVMSSLDLHVVLAQLSKHAKNLIGVDAVTIALLENGTLVTASYEGIGESFNYNETSTAYLAGKGLGGRALQTGQIITCSDYWSDPLIEHDTAIDRQVKEKGMRASMAVPIYVKGEVAAILWANKLEPYLWTQTDILRGEQFASLASLAILNAWLYNRLEKVNRQLVARNQELEALQEFNRRLRGPLDLKGAAERALALSLEVLGGDIGSLHLLDDQDPAFLNLIVQHGFGVTPPGWLVRMQVGAGLAGKVAETGQSMLVNDVVELMRQQPGVTLDPNPPWRSALFVPLVSSGQNTGVIGFTSYHPNHFTAEHLRFAEMIAAQIGTAIQQVTQIEMQKERDQLAAALTLARTAAHDLNQPLTLLQVELQFATQYGEMPDKETLERMQEAVSSIASLVREYQSFVRFQTTEAIPGISIIDRSRATSNSHSSGIK